MNGPHSSVSYAGVLYVGIPYASIIVAIGAILVATPAIARQVTKQDSTAVFEVSRTLRGLRWVAP